MLWKYRFQVRVNWQLSVTRPNDPAAYEIYTLRSLEEMQKRYVEGKLDPRVN